MSECLHGYGRHTKFVIEMIHISHLCACRNVKWINVQLVKCTIPLHVPPSTRLQHVLDITNVDAGNNHVFS